MVLIVGSDGADHGDEVIIQQRIQQMGIHFPHRSDKADILSVSRCPSVNAKDGSILSADAHCLQACLFHHGYQSLVHPVEHHLRDLDRIRIRHTQAAHKAGLQSDPSDPFCDLFPASVYDDRPEAHKFEQRHVPDHAFLQFMLNHGAPAVFYYDRLAMELADIRQRFDQYIRFCQQCFH